MRRKSSKSERERFAEKVDFSDGQGPFGEYWEWTANKMDAGYGKFVIDGRTKSATHYVITKILNKDIPKGMQVNHSCDNPACVKWSHLWVGNQSENINDCIQKGRWKPSRGEKQWNSKLTEARVNVIREEKGKMTQKELGKLFGVSSSTIGFIHNNKRWTHIDA